MTGRRWRGAEPPWGQATVPVTPISPRVYREARTARAIGLRRGRYVRTLTAEAHPFVKHHSAARTPRIVRLSRRPAFVPLGQASIVTNGYFAPSRLRQHPAFVGFYQKRGRFVFASFPATVTPTGPNLVFRQGQRRTQPPYMRRGKLWVPTPPQADPLTNGYFLPQRLHATQEATRQWQRRGRVWQHLHGQTTFWLPQRLREPVSSTRFWLKRSHFVWANFPASITPSAPNLVFRQGQRRTAPPYFKRGRLWLPTPPQADPLTNGYYQPSRYRGTVEATRQWQRRGKLWLPVPGQVIVPNPSLTEFKGRRAYRRVYEYAKRGRTVAPTWFQAYGPNPPIPGQLWFARRVPRWWFGPRRTKLVIPGWGQAILTYVPSVGVYDADEFVVALYIADEEEV